MKSKTPLLAVFLVFMIMLPVLAGAKEERKKPESSQDRISYALGVNLGGNFAAQGLTVNAEFLMQGLKDALADAPLLLTDEELRDAMLALRQEMQQKQQARMEEISRKNMSESNAFLRRMARGGSSPSPAASNIR